MFTFIQNVNVVKSMCDHLFELKNEYDEEWESLELMDKRYNIRYTKMEIANMKEALEALEERLEVEQQFMTNTRLKLAISYDDIKAGIDEFNEKVRKIMNNLNIYRDMVISQLEKEIEDYQDKISNLKSEIYTNWHESLEHCDETARSYEYLSSIGQNPEIALINPRLIRKVTSIDDLRTLKDEISSKISSQLDAEYNIGRCLGEIDRLRRSIERLKSGIPERFRRQIISLAKEDFDGYNETRNKLFECLKAVNKRELKKRGLLTILAIE